MVEDKNITKLSLDYQDYLTYLNINLTLAISVFIAFFSYVLTSFTALRKESLSLLIILLIFLSIEIIFVSVHFWLINEKRTIRLKIGV